MAKRLRGWAVALVLVCVFGQAGAWAMPLDGVRMRDQVGTRSFTISAVGDVILGGDKERGTLETFKKYLAKYEKETGDRNTGMFVNAIPFFQQDDITLANLECTLVKDGLYAPKSKYVFRGETSYAQILKASSIEMVTLANNHSDDFGSKGYASTKSALKAAGVSYNGHRYGESRILDVNGLRVGFIGFQTGSSAGKTSIQNDVRKLKAKCDVVIVSLHFGDVPEYTYKVESYQRTYAKRAVNAGADLVLGHHPHVISGFEKYKGVNIVYGLGSFLNVGPNPIRPRRTMIFQQTFEVSARGVEVKDVRVVPFWITTSKKTNTMRPMVAPADEQGKIRQMIDKYSVGNKVDYSFVTEPIVTEPGA